MSIRNTERLFAADSSIGDGSSLLGKVFAWVLILVLIGFGGILWFDEDKRNQFFALVETNLNKWFPDQKPESATPSLAPDPGRLDQLTEEISNLEQEPAVLYPIPDSTTTEKPVPSARLPELKHSDPVINKEISRLVGTSDYKNLLVSKFVIERFVITIDSLTRKKIPIRQKFYTSPKGQLQVYRDATGDIYLDPENFTRYRQFVKLAESVSVEGLVAIYRKYYPLFQQAYEELGYPNKYFNDRLIEVIDHILAPPPVKTPLKLKRPGVYYMYVSPELEKRSAGQKILIRMGNDNAARLKSALRKIHGLLLSDE